MVARLRYEAGLRAKGARLVYTSGWADLASGGVVGRGLSLVSQGNILAFIMASQHTVWQALGCQFLQMVKY